jgi:hypothetical protein
VNSISRVGGKREETDGPKSAGVAVVGVTDVLASIEDVAGNVAARGSRNSAAGSSPATTGSFAAMAPGGSGRPRGIMPRCEWKLGVIESDMESSPVLVCCGLVAFRLTCIGLGWVRTRAGEPALLGPAPSVLAIAARSCPRPPHRPAGGHGFIERRGGGHALVAYGATGDS